MNASNDINIDLAPEMNEYVLRVAPTLIRDLILHFTPESEFVGMTELEITEACSDPNLLKLVGDALVGSYNEGVHRAVGHVLAALIERGQNFTINYTDSDTGEAIH